VGETNTLTGTGNEEFPIYWLGGTDLVEDEAGNIYGNLDVDRVIAEMLIRDRDSLKWENPGLEFESGDYYVYVQNNETNKISKASDKTFSFTQLTEQNTNDTPTAKWTVYHDNIVRYDEARDRWVWYEDDYRDAHPGVRNEDIPRPEVPAEGYTEFGYTYHSYDNFKTIMFDADNDDKIVAYIIRAAEGGLFKDKDDEFVVYRGDGDLRDATSAYAMMDGFNGIEVAAVCNDGTISKFVQATMAAPWEADDRYVVVPSYLNDDGKTVTFDAPAYTRDKNKYPVRFEQNDPNDPDDDIYYVERVGFNVYIDNPDSEDYGLRYIRRGVENETISNNEANRTSIHKNAVLMEMVYMYEEEGAELESGVYNINPQTFNEVEDKD
jgi:hypothetical protein